MNINIHLLSMIVLTKLGLRQKYGTITKFKNETGRVVTSSKLI